MKALALLLTIALLLAGPQLHAQQTGGAPAGAAATGASTAPISWAVALLGVAVAATVGGIAAVSASSPPTSYNH